MVMKGLYTGLFSFKNILMGVLQKVYIIHRVERERNHRRQFSDSQDHGCSTFC